MLKKYFKIIHEAFEIGIIIKAVHAVLDIIAGIFLLAESARLGKWLNTLINFELREDPKDFVANYLVQFSHYLINQPHYYPIIYLLIHGALNVFFVIALWRKKLWAYPVAAALFTAFLGFQVYRLITHFSWGLFIVMIFDILIIALIGLEYERIEIIDKK